MSEPRDTGPLAGRVALVTGATRGIGRACAVSLGEAGAHVIALGRTQGALEELDDELRTRTGRGATLVPLDLSDGPALDALGGVIFQRHGKLDILVHAAGMLGGLRPVAHIPPELWDRIVSVNLTSVFRLIRSLEPLMRASEAGRAIFLSSSVAAKPKAFWGSYAATKAAVEALARSWADEVDVSPLRVAIVNPGPMRTRMRAEAYPGEDPQTLPAPSEIAPLILEICLSPDPGAPCETIDFRAWRAARSAPATTA
ncbi:MAG TPA: SDR family NAD(P)-dependent oxidoreductase [Caulobacteraceae bacterium]|jgi:NAD(P)-dependent dehydrogenase (short-subunit alcohol dehydrogenase family)|nr:SDR family NAD(P)-dependent oxidoreductase [Caulobacteraceae bacterium]